jgi:hypothetical protein
MQIDVGHPIGNITSSVHAISILDKVKLHFIDFKLFLDEPFHFKASIKFHKRLNSHLHLAANEAVLINSSRMHLATNCVYLSPSSAFASGKSDYILVLFDFDLCLTK